MEPVVIASHEFAHATIQPGALVPPSRALQVLEDSSRINDTIKNFTVMQHFMREVHADLFSAAVSLAPKAWVSFRQGAYASAKGVSPDDKLDLPVISPEELENPDSPLYSRLREFLGEHLAFANNPVTERDMLSKQAYDQYVQEARSGTAEGLSKFSNALAGSSQLLLLFTQASLLEKGEEGPLKELMDMQSSRALSISYAVGKSRPDLIGKTVQIDAEGNIIAPSGELIDPADILPDIPIIGMSEPEEIHPVLMERAFEAQELYNRARQALRQGYRFEPPPIQAADVVNTWRREFERIVG